jgi:hypothetical protein
MALWFPLRVNDERIGTFYAQRREPAVPDDRVCTYDVTVVDPTGERRAVVRHNYDHGAFALVQTALSAVATPSEEGGNDG